MVNMFGPGTGEANNWFYSFYMGPALFIAINTEFYFWNYGTIMMANQYRWLEQTLVLANKPENRKKWPWIITFGHRPMYCSNLDHDDCTEWGSVVSNNKFSPMSFLVILLCLFYIL